VNGKRFDWEAGDVVFTPLLSWHQSGTEGGDPVRYITAGTIPFCWPTHHNLETSRRFS
jgi:gentisate 1,2-dioxygenase